MKLKELMMMVGISVNSEEDVTGIEINSKKICSGNIFIAKNGENHDCEEFIEEAYSNGAIYIIKECGIEKEKELVVSNLEDIKAKLAYSFYQYPQNKLKIIGITGTNGKTSTSSIIANLFEQLNIPVMIIGTNGAKCKNYYYELDNTTPDAVTLAKIFSKAVELNCSYVVMEVSSHSLIFNRVRELTFDYAIFTNLSNEHLDFHVTMDEYAKAKAKLFSKLKKDGVGIINEDDAYAAIMKENCFNKIITFGKSHNSDYQIEVISTTPTESKFKINKIFYSMNLITLANIYNVTAAIALFKHLEVKDVVLQSLLTHLKAIEGRIEIIKVKDFFTVIDFAHTPAAMKMILEFLKSICHGKLICVFGCGGNRDKSKRPLMGKFASEICDKVIITSDNPRYEDPYQIINEVILGIEKENYMTSVERKDAICMALSQAKKDDIIVILGKGHEKYQIIKDKKIPFSDKEVVEIWMHNYWCLSNLF